MSGIGPAGGGQNPFENIFGDLARMLSGASGGGPLNWDVARQVASMIATDGGAEANVDPLDRIRLESLARVAELHVGEVTGLDITLTGVEAITHLEWATRTLRDWSEMLEQLATALAQQNTSDTPDTPDNPFGALGEANPMFAQLGNMEQFISPLIMGMQAGGMIGHLSKRSLGLFDLPVPRTTTTRLVMVPSTIKTFAEEWSLSLDELSLYVAIEEATRMAVLNRTPVATRLRSLIIEYVSGFQPDAESLESRLEGFDMSDPSSIPAALNDPQALLGAIQTPAQDQTLVQLQALLGAFVGYVDHVVATVSQRTIASSASIAEAIKRRRVEESDGHRLVEKLLGLELAQPTFDRGDAFVRGVLERSGDTGLARLWHSERELPTPAEVDAPGLWLARIDIPATD